MLARGCLGSTKWTRGNPVGGLGVNFGGGVGVEFVRDFKGGTQWCPNLGGPGGWARLILIRHILHWGHSRWGRRGEQA